MQKVRVLIVDDSAFVQRAVERMLAEFDGIEVVGTARDGAQAVERARTLAPDVVLLDIQMPHMDGLEALERIMAESPTAVILMSTITAEDAEVTIRGLELGAVDFIDKSKAGGTLLDIYDLAPTLRDKIRSAADAALRAEAPVAAPGAGRTEAGARNARSDVSALPVTSCRYDVVVVGASTGGPRALSRLLADLPADFPAPIVVAQHMPAGFTTALAGRLDRRCALRVHEAAADERLEAGTVLIGPGGRRLRVERSRDGLVVRLPQSPQEDEPRPSVDELFDSAAEAAGDRCVGVVLTGMGADGARGLRHIRDGGGATIVESSDTATIYGMPREARGAAQHELDIDRIGAALVGLCDGGPGAPVRRASP